MANSLRPSVRSISAGNGRELAGAGAAEFLMTSTGPPGPWSGGGGGGAAVVNDQLTGRHQVAGRVAGAADRGGVRRSSVASAASGVNVAVLVAASYAIVPATAPDGPVSVIVDGRRR